MKNRINVSLDEEIIEELRKETNYSDVVNEQLKAFYAVKQCDNLEILQQKLAEIKHILKENRKKRREIEKKIKKVKENIKLRKEEMRRNFKFSTSNEDEARAYIREVLKGGAE